VKTWLRTLSPRDRRAIVLGAPVLCLGLIWRLALGPFVHALVETADRLESERALLARERALLATVRGSSGVAEDLSRRLLREVRHLFGGPDASSTMSALMGYVQTAATGSHVLLSRVEPLAPRFAGAGLTALPMQIRGEGDLEGLVSLLYLLETSVKRVRVERLHIRGSRTGSASAPEPREVLDFDFMVTGYMLEDSLHPPSAGPAAGNSQ
jgi:hypothetical protein